MGWTEVALWTCSMVGVGCNLTPAPSVATIQAAYDREVSNASSLHDKNLQVLEAKCDVKNADGRYLCQVTFMSTADRTQRLYFDIVSVAPLGSDWELKSGLCRR